MGEELDPEAVFTAMHRPLPPRSVSKNDIMSLTRKMHSLQQLGLDYVNRGNGDDYMLRVEMLGLQQHLDEILKRSEKTK